MLNVIETTKEFLPKLTNVKIMPKAIQTLVDDIKEEELKVSEISLSKFKWSTNQLLELTFLFNTLNFCFWSSKNEPKWTIKDANLDGAIALFRCLENEYRTNTDFLSPNKLATMQHTEL